MLTLFILLILAYGFYTGAQRGLLLQIIYSVGYLISYLVARMYYKELASHLELFVPYPSATASTKLVFFNQEITLDLDQAFYGAVAFMLLLFAGWLVIRFIGIFLRALTSVPLLKEANWLLGGVLNLIIVYIGVFLLLTMVSMIPTDNIQNQFRQSGLARTIVEHTPILSKQIYQFWVQKMIG